MTLYSELEKEIKTGKLTEEFSFSDLSMLNKCGFGKIKIGDECFSETSVRNQLWSYSISLDEKKMGYKVKKGRKVLLG